MSCVQGFDLDQGLGFWSRVQLKLWGFRASVWIRVEVLGFRVSALGFRVSGHVCGLVFRF